MISDTFSACRQENKNRHDIQTKISFFILFPTLILKLDLYSISIITGGKNSSQFSRGRAIKG